MKQKLTPWFPADVKPVHVGWYQAKYSGFLPMWRYWNGVNWVMSYGNDSCTFDLESLTPDHALISEFGRPPFVHGEGWRGLAEKPE